MEHGLLTSVLILMAVGLPLVLLAQHLRISALVAYLATGALAGPYGILHVVDPEQIRPLAEIGACLLLFALGLELDVHTMRPQLRTMTISSGLQMGLTLLAGTAAAFAFGLPLGQSVAVACCLTMSSTLMVLRALEERGIRNRHEGETVVGMLLAQDLCLAPFLVVISLVTPGASQQPFWLISVGMVACLGSTYLLRRVLATALVSRIRATQLPELEVAFSVTVALGASFLTSYFGLGAALGAFCAGLALGGDEHRSVIESSTRPLQGLMAIMFFVSIGVMFDASYLVNYPLAVLGGLAISILLKSLLGAAALRIAGLPLRSAVGCGIMTGQIGEFSFVLAATAFGHGQDPATRHLYFLIIVVTCLSLALTPFLVRVAMMFLPHNRVEDITERGDTIVVAGLGPVGNSVVLTLHGMGHPLLLVDRNERLLAPWRDTPGIRCHKGRIEDMGSWLPILGKRPALIVLTFPVADTSAIVASRLRALAPELFIVARSAFESQIDTLHNAGVQYVICDELETTRALVPVLEEALGREKAERPTTRYEKWGPDDDARLD